MKDFAVLSITGSVCVPQGSQDSENRLARMIVVELPKLTLDNDTFENTGKSRFFERRTSRVLY